MRCSGLRQPLPARPRPASMNEADMILTKCRRETGSVHSLAPAGNSRSTHCRNSAVSANCSRLRQYLRPVSGSGQDGGIVFIVGALIRNPVRKRAKRLECAELAPALERDGGTKAGASSTHSKRFAPFRSQGLLSKLFSSMTRRARLQRFHVPLLHQL